MGVLDGQVLRSTGRTGKDLELTLGERSPRGQELPGHGVDLLAELPELSERGSVSVVGRRPLISSSSLMEGNYYTRNWGVTVLVASVQNRINKTMSLHVQGFATHRF